MPDGYVSINNGAKSSKQVFFTDTKTAKNAQFADNREIKKHLSVTSLLAVSLKDENNNELISDEIKKKLLQNEEIKKTDIANIDGTIKKGFNIFDLNSDGKLDNTEFSVFASGGKLGKIQEKTESIKMNQFIDSQIFLDEFNSDDFDYLQKKTKDIQCSASDRNKIYKLKEATNYLVEGLNKFSPEIKTTYEKALKDINFLGKTDNETIRGGGYLNSVVESNLIYINGIESRSKEEIASTLIHELTHKIQKEKYSRQSVLLNESQAYYMQNIFLYKQGIDISNTEIGENILSNSCNTQESLCPSKIATKSFVESSLFSQYCEMYDMDVEIEKDRLMNRGHLRTIGDMDFEAQKQVIDPKDAFLLVEASY